MSADERYPLPTTTSLTDVPPERGATAEEWRAAVACLSGPGTVVEHIAQALTDQRFRYETAATQLARLAADRRTDDGAEKRMPLRIYDRYIGCAEGYEAAAQIIRGVGGPR